MTDEKSLAGLLTPEGNEATERCPICGRLNSAGACDHCNHFYGAYWDGDIILSDRFSDFEKVWDEYLSLLSHLGSLHDDPVQVCKNLVEERGLRGEILQLDPDEHSADSALVDLVDFTYGPYEESDGMAGGGGYLLYLEDFSPYTSLLAQCKDAIAACQQALLT